MSPAYLQARKANTLDGSSTTYTRAGTMRNGVVSPLPHKAHPIGGREFLSWPTPTATGDSFSADFSRSAHQRQWDRRKLPGRPGRITTICLLRLAGVAIILLPAVYEWLMGFPEGWTQPETPATAP